MLAIVVGEGSLTVISDSGVCDLDRVGDGDGDLRDTVEGIVNFLTCLPVIFLVPIGVV